MDTTYVTYLLAFSLICTTLLDWITKKKPNLKKITFRVKASSIVLIVASFFAGFYSEQAYLIVLICSEIVIWCGLIYAFRYQPKDDKTTNKE